MSSGKAINYANWHKDDKTNLEYQKMYEEAVAKTNALRNKNRAKGYVPKVSRRNAREMPKYTEELRLDTARINSARLETDRLEGEAARAYTATLVAEDLANTEAENPSVPDDDDDDENILTVETAFDAAPTNPLKFEMPSLLERFPKKVDAPPMQMTRNGIGVIADFRAGEELRAVPWGLSPRMTVPQELRDDIYMETMEREFRATPNL